MIIPQAGLPSDLLPTVTAFVSALPNLGGVLGVGIVGTVINNRFRAGVAALHIEDQVQTKRCGHLLGKQVVSREEFVTRIRAAVIARDAIPGGSDFVRLLFDSNPSFATSS